MQENAANDLGLKDGGPWGLFCGSSILTG